MVLGFEVLTAVVMMSTIFWDITPCSPLKVNWLFGGSYRLYLQGRRIRRVRNELESRWQEKRNDPPKRRLTFGGLLGVISQKMVLLTPCSIMEENSLKINARCFLEKSSRKYPIREKFSFGWRPRNFTGKYQQAVGFSFLVYFNILLYLYIY
jgi:hypothetical protein